jgi:hypothetical protein
MMANKEQFRETVKAGYTFKGEAIRIGRGMLDGQVVDGADIFLPLKNHEPAWLDCRRYRHRQNEDASTDQ